MLTLAMLTIPLRSPRERFEPNSVRISASRVRAMCPSALAKPRGSLGQPVGEAVRQ
jgi:hypothetical protein